MLLVFIATMAVSGDASDEILLYFGKITLASYVLASAAAKYSWQAAEQWGHPLRAHSSAMPSARAVLDAK